ncbi:Glycosyltransferase [Vibrio chagasii]|nr:Glycosyltransferase [Vibrio chagasii]CAH7328422.1 Glycosyltransferase [Vibrio chagasii]
MKLLLKNLFNMIFCLKHRIQIKYIFKLKKKLDFKSPKSFNEKIQSRKLFYSKDSDLKFSDYADKIKVKKYVKELIGDEYLIPTLHHSSRLDFDIKKYENVVVKCNHSSGKVHIIKEKLTSVQESEIKRELEKDLVFDYGKHSDEGWYSDIEPAVLVESLLLDKSGSVPNDYKFHVFNNTGKIYVQVDFDRFTDHNRTIYDENGNIQEWSIGYKNYFREFPEIQYINKMVKLAKKLANGFDYVRVDLYLLDGRIYFGEYTFAHGSGFEAIAPEKYDTILGGNWK